MTSRRSRSRSAATCFAWRAATFDPVTSWGLGAPAGRVAVDHVRLRELDDRGVPLVLLRGRPPPGPVPVAGRLVLPRVLRVRVRRARAAAGTPARGPRAMAFTLDLATVMFVTLMVVWYLVVDPTVHRGDSLLNEVLTLAYPVGDVILVLGAAHACSCADAPAASVTPRCGCSRAGRCSSRSPTSSTRGSSCRGATRRGRCPTHSGSSRCLAIAIAAFTGAALAHPSSLSSEEPGRRRAAGEQASSTSRCSSASRSC